MNKTQFADREQLTGALSNIEQSPINGGTVELIVIRPDVDQRQILEEGVLSVSDGLQGDNWRKKFNPNKHHSAKKDEQLTLINSRLMRSIAGDNENWKWSGDQFYVDLDLSYSNLPAGSRLKLGEAIIEITVEPHLGCQKFAQRYGKEAVLFVNSDLGKSLNLRGIKAFVVEPGRVRKGDKIEKVISKPND